MSTTLKLNVEGMTCSSCEVLLERSLKKVPGVHAAKVSLAKKEATVDCSEEVDISQLREAVREKGYALSLKSAGTKKNKFIHLDKERWSEIGSVLVIIIGIYFVLKQLDLLPQSIGVTETMSYGLIFIIGLVAATSTCLAVTGGLLLAVAGKYNEKYPHLTGIQRFKPHLYFNLGRIISYTLLGGLIGLLGSVLTLSPAVTGTIIIMASILMVIIGLQLLHIFPWLDYIQVKVPKFIAHKIYKNSHEHASAPGRISSFFFGASTFFLPCGFTQALQLYVLGKGDFTTGAVTMLVFSVGTLPSLIGVGAFSSFTKGSLQRHFIAFSAVLVIVLGIFNIPNGMVLAGAVVGNDGTSSFAAPAPGENVNIIDGKQIAEMKVIGLEYAPHKFTILRGVPVEWRIDGTKAQGCAQVITVPKLGITEFLPRDEIKTITFTPSELGTLPFSCTMGMTTYGAAFEVIPNTAGVKSATLVEGLPENEPTGEVQKLQMEISRERGFYPKSFTVKKNIPVELEIDTQIPLGGCMSTLVIPEYNVAHLLSVGKTTLRFTPTQEGIIPFTCSMGAKMGEFVVVEDHENS